MEVNPVRKHPRQPFRIRRGWLLLLFFAGAVAYFSSGRYGLIHYLTLARQRQNLQAEIQRLKQEQFELQAKAERLETDLKEVERVAREKYKMGRSDEVIFVVPEK
jgi:cell division protein FtsB